MNIVYFMYAYIFERETINRGIGETLSAGVGRGGERDRNYFRIDNLQWQSGPVFFFFHLREFFDYFIEIWKLRAR